MDELQLIAHTAGADATSVAPTSLTCWHLKARAKPAQGRTTSEARNITAVRAVRISVAATAISVAATA